MNVKVNNSNSEFKPPTQTDHVVTVSSSVVTLTAASLPASHQYVYMQNQGATIRATYDGSTPSASNGDQIATGERVTVRRDLALAMKFIREGATDSVIWAQPFGS